MYQPPQFIAKDESHALELMRTYPFASLISNDEGGFPYVTHLPLHTELRSTGDSQKIVLLGHVAKPNQQQAWIGVYLWPTHLKIQEAGLTLLRPRSC